LPKDPDFAKIRNLNLDKAKKDKYDRLESDALSVLKDGEHAEVFIQAMALAVKEGTKKPLDDPYPLINMSSLSEEQEWLIKAVAISDSDGVEILNQPRQMVKIAEEYANAGIDLLFDRTYRGSGEYAKRLEEELSSIAKQEQTAKVSTE
jgi:dnd system-associated protein 4